MWNYIRLGLLSGRDDWCDDYSIVMDSTPLGADCTMTTAVAAHLFGILLYIFGWLGCSFKSG